VYTPDPASADVYDDLYAEYVRLHDYFGRGANEVMHRLRALRDRVLAAETSAPETSAAETSAPGTSAPDTSASAPAGPGQQQTPSPEGSQR
jgi:L-ribulokinase